MNDYPVFVAVRKLPKSYIRPGLNVTLFGDAGVVAIHPDLKPMVFKDGKWKALTLRQVNKRS